MASLVSREGNKLRKAEVIKQGKKRSGLRRIGVVHVEVEVTSDDEFRGGRDKVFKKDSEFSVESRRGGRRRTVNDK